MRRIAALAIPLITALPLAAQTRPGAVTPPPKTGAAPASAPASGTATLSGSVFDSLSMKPLAGASIVISGSNMTAISDAAGHYALPVDSLSEGVHEIGFFHPVLDSLGIAPPTHRIAIKHGVSAILDLAMPSAATLVASVCPDSQRVGARGLLIGEVRDADADKPLDSAIVVVMWTDIQVQTNNISKLPRAISARTDKTGIYRLCGVPPNTPLRAQARKQPKASGWIEMAIPPSGAIVQEFLIGTRPATATTSTTAGGGAAVGSAAVGAGTSASPVGSGPLGSAMLTGTVVGADGAPLEGAQVMLLGTNLSGRSDARGIFRMKELPSGTQEVEVRLLSYQPKQYMVNLAAKKESHLNAVLDTRVQVLEPRVVNARPTSDIPGYDDRKEHATGTFMDHEFIMNNSVASISDVFRRVAGMQVVFVNDTYTIVSNRGALANGCRSAQFWIDGVRFDLGNEESLDDVVHPPEVAAIEVYNSGNDTPAIFQSGQYQCGTVVIWTNNGHFKKKGVPADTTH